MSDNTHSVKLNLNRGETAPCRASDLGFRPYGCRKRIARAMAAPAGTSRSRQLSSYASPSQALSPGSDGGSRRRLDCKRNGARNFRRDQCSGRGTWRVGVSRDRRQCTSTLNRTSGRRIRDRSESHDGFDGFLITTPGEFGNRRSESESASVATGRPRPIVDSGRTRLGWNIRGRNSLTRLGHPCEFGLVRLILHDVLCQRNH